MEQQPPAQRLSLFSGQRPMWQRVLLWVVIALLAINIVFPLLFMFGNAIQRVTGGILGSGFTGFVVALAVFFAFAAPRGGLNLLRTATNKTTSDFTRRDDPARGGYMYEVTPARASWLAILVPLPLCAFVAMWGVYTIWMMYFGMALYFLVVGIIVLPGALDRKPVTISVSPQGIHSDDVSLPLDRIAELDVMLGGVKVSEDPLMPGRNGVSTSAMVGRGLGRRQAARSFSLTLRGDGQSLATPIAGGLTQPCADNLHRDILKAVASFGATGASA